MKVEKLRKSFGTRVLFSDLSFEIQTGMLEIKGPSGCGKSTLVHILLGTEKADSGTFAITDHEPAKIAYSGQEPSLFSDFSLKKNLLLLGRETDTIQSLTEILNFTQNLNMPLYQMSGGERQKAEVIACLSQEADLYVLDEPFSSLDAETKKALADFLWSFSRKHLVLIVNHDPNIDFPDAETRLLFDGEGKVTVISGKHPEVSKEAEEPLPPQPKPRKVRTRSLATRLYVRNQKLNFFLKLILTCLMVVFFSLGCSFLNTKSDVENTEISLENDPFAIHGLATENVEPLKSSFFDDFASQGYLTLTVDIKGTGGHMLFVGSLPDTNTSLLAYHPEENPLAFTVDETLTLGKNTYPVQVVSSHAAVLSQPYGKPIQSIIDGYDSFVGVLFVTPAFFTDMFLHGGPQGIALDKEPTVSFASLTGITANASDRLLLSDSGETITVNGTSNDYFLAVKGHSAGSTISLWDDNIHETAEELTTTDALPADSATDVMMNLNQYQDFLLHASSILMDSGSGFFYYSFDRALYRKAESYGDFKALDIVIPYSRFGNDKMILFFALAVVCLVIELIYLFVSEKGIRKWARTLTSVYRHNGLSEKKVKDSFAAISLLETLPFAVLGFLLYPLAGIPFANYQNMVDRFQRVPAGFYYYSQQPLNPYYDALKTPFAFNSWENVFVGILALLALLWVCDYLTLLHASRTKDKASS
jgi:ABC-type multidrug transport system ATPase subunit